MAIAVFGPVRHAGDYEAGGALLGGSTPLRRVPEAQQREGVHRPTLRPPLDRFGLGPGESGGCFSLHAMLGVQGWQERAGRQSCYCSLLAFFWQKLS